MSIASIDFFINRESRYCDRYANRQAILHCCGHGCLSCYVNYDRETLQRNMTLHNKKIPFLIGNLQVGDVIKDAKQVSWKDRQMSIFDLIP